MQSKATDDPGPVSLANSGTDVSCNLFGHGLKSYNLLFRTCVKLLEQDRIQTETRQARTTQWWRWPPNPCRKHKDGLAAVSSLQR